jgi:hypothetical protein
MICNNMPDGCPHPDYCEFHGTCRCTPIKVGREFIRMAGVDEVLASPEFQAGIDEIMRDTLRKFVQHDNSLLKPRSIGATKPKGLPATWLQDELTRMAQEYGLYGGEE